MNEVDHSTEIYFEIKPYDIDASGHVNNAVYINWLEDLRFKLFRKYIRLNDLISIKRAERGNGKKRRFSVRLLNALEMVAAQLAADFRSLLLQLADVSVDDPCL